jgi:hypothetical protein
MSAAVEPVGRAVLIAFSLGAWFWSQRLIGRRQAPAGAIGDRLHELTSGLHARLRRHRRSADATLIASSAVIDLLGLFLIAATLLGPSLRPFLGLLIVFALRQGCQAMISLPAPPGMIWHRPPFPSLLVTYGVSTDLFFSGHTAIAVLAACEIARLGVPLLTAVAVAIALLEAGVVVVLRAHWTMDVFAAVFAALFASTAAAALAPRCDALLRGAIGVSWGA